MKRTRLLAICVLLAQLLLLGSVPIAGQESTPLAEVTDRPGNVPFEVYRNWTFEDWCLANRNKSLTDEFWELSDLQKYTVNQIEKKIGASVADRMLLRDTTEEAFIKETYAPVEGDPYSDYAYCNLYFEFSRRESLVDANRMDFGGASLSELGPFYSLKKDMYFRLADMDDDCPYLELNEYGHCNSTAGPELSPVISLDRLDVLRRLAQSRYQIRKTPNHPVLTLKNGGPIAHYQYYDEGYSRRAAWVEPEFERLDLSNNQHIVTVLAAELRARLAEIEELTGEERDEAKQLARRDHTGCYIQEFIEEEIDCSFGL